MRRTPARKGRRIDSNTHDRVPVGLETLLHFLGHLQPLGPDPWLAVAVVEYLQRGRIIRLHGPEGADGPQGLFVRFRHGPILPSRRRGAGLLMNAAAGKPRERARSNVETGD